MNVRFALHRFRFPLLLLLLVCSASAQERAARILIVYHSVHGHTRALASAVAEGARSASPVDVRLLDVQTADPVRDVEWADAIVVGSPVYNGNVAPEVQSFINRWPFEGNVLKDKLGAAFVTAGGISAGEELALVSVLHSMMMFGMVVVGGDTWMSAFGASAITGEDPFGSEPPGTIGGQFKTKGFQLGARIARLAVRLQE